MKRSETEKYFQGKRKTRTQSPFITQILTVPVETGTNGFERHFMSLMESSVDLFGSFASISL